MLKHWLLLLHLQIYKQCVRLSNTTTATNAAQAATSEERGSYCKYCASKSFPQSSLMARAQEGGLSFGK